MKKIVLIPDSFKGTMSSCDVCETMERAIRNHYPDISVVSVPVADGGEGSVDAFLTAVGGERVTCTVCGPNNKPTEGFYGILDNGKTAVIEMAAAAGLPLMGDTPDVLNATTYGVGELILSAARKGVKKIIMGLGGSATNDAGCGAAVACGVKFYDENNEPFIPVGGTLSKIKKIDVSGMDNCLDGVVIETMCDISNPMYGPRGASYVFARQKGGDTEEKLKLLDDGLRHTAMCIKRDLGIDVSDLSGGGAAGGMGGGMCAFFGSTLKMGIETVLDTVGFDEILSGADLVLSGEGRIDSQTAGGKVVAGVAYRTKRAGVPLIAVVGDIGLTDDEGDMTPLYDVGVTAIVSINRVALPFSLAKHRAKNDLYHVVDDLMRIMKIKG